MPRIRLLLTMSSVAMACAAHRVRADDDLNTALAKVVQALDFGRTDEALQAADAAVRQAPTSADAHAVRARVRSARHEYAEAVRDLDRALELAPGRAAWIDARGSARFQAGDAEGAAADFDRYLELSPQEGPGHWRRGIACYYVGKYAEGAAQFASYQDVDSADVENGVWHYLCNAKVVGPEKARQELLPIGEDRRVPLMVVYALFRGEATVDDVEKRCREPGLTPAEKRQRNFYANLYLGLYHISEGEEDRARERLAAAADKENAVFGYMWDVARVHADLLGKKAK